MKFFQQYFLPSFLHRCKAKGSICTYQGTLLLIQGMNEGHLQLQSFHERLPPSQFRVTIIVLIQQISAFFFQRFLDSVLSSVFSK